MFVVGAVVAKLSTEKLFIFSVKSQAIFVESRLKPENLHFLLFLSLCSFVATVCIIISFLLILWFEFLCLILELSCYYVFDWSWIFWNYDQLVRTSSPMLLKTLSPVFWVRKILSTKWVRYIESTIWEYEVRFVCSGWEVRE